MSKATEANADVTVEQVLSELLHTDSLAAAKVLTAQEAGCLRDFITDPPEERQTLLEEAGGLQLFESFVKVMKSWSNEVDVRYIVTLVDELLRENATRADLFLQVKTSNSDLCACSALLSVLERFSANGFVVARAAHALSLVVGAACKRGVTSDAPAAFAWIVRTLQTPSPKTLVPALAALKELLKHDLLHEPFVHGVHTEGEEEKYASSTDRVSHNLSALVALLGSQSQNTQVLYEVGFSLWLLSYNAALVPALRAAKAIRALVTVIKSLLRVKVVRVALATLRNLLDKEGANQDMIDAGLPRLLPQVAARLTQWGDEEVADDTKAIEASLSKDMKDLSSFEMYEREVNSGELAWSVVHAEKFWKENFQKFEKDNFKLIRALVALIGRSEDKVTLEVACYDLGEFARFHPNGKKLLQKTEGKERLMKRMSHSSPEVAKQALLAVQKLMVNNWEFLGGNAAPAAAKA